MLSVLVPKTCCLAYLFRPLYHFGGRSSGPGLFGNTGRETLGIWEQQEVIPLPHKLHALTQDPGGCRFASGHVRNFDFVRLVGSQLAQCILK